MRSWRIICVRCSDQKRERYTGTQDILRLSWRCINYTSVQESRIICVLHSIFLMSEGSSPATSCQKAIIRTEPSSSRNSRILVWITARQTDRWQSRTRRRAMPSELCTCTAEWLMLRLRQVMNGCFGSARCSGRILSADRCM